MAFSSTLMLPPLLEIQKHMSYLSNKYNNKVYLDALVKNSARDIQGIGGAPRSAVMNFLSSVSDLLFRYNILKKTVDSEYRQRKILATSYLIIALIFIFIVVFVIIRFFLWDLLTDEEDRLLRLQYMYFMALVVLVSVYLLIIAVIIFRKNMNLYKSVYQTDVLNEEPVVKHIISMMDIKPQDLNINNKNATVHVSNGTNPLMGYFVYQNKGYNVVYRLNDTNQSLGSSSCAQNKVFKFLSTSKKPYTLDTTESTGLLHPSNLPCSVVDGNLKYVDPFVQINGSMIVDPAVLLKKLRKYDFYGQANRLGDAVDYFKNYMLKAKDVPNKPLDDAAKKNIIDYINTSLQSDFIILKGYSPYRSALVSMGKKPDAYKNVDLILAALNDENCMCACFIGTSDYTGGFKLTSSDLSKLVFNFENNDVSNNFIMVKSSSIQSIYMSSETKPTMALFNTGAQMNGSDTPVNSCFEMNIDPQNSTAIGPKDNFVYMPLAKTPFGPNLRSIFKDTPKNSTPMVPGDHVYVVCLNTASLVKQTFSISIGHTLMLARPALVQRIAQGMIAKDPDNLFTMDTTVINNIITSLKTYYGTSFSQVSGVVNDIMTEFPSSVLKLRNNDGQPLEGYEDSYYSKYITYSRFVTKFKELGQAEFADNFLGNIEEIRDTSSGLRKIYQKYDYRRPNHDKNKLMLNITFYVVLIIGMLELIRFGLNKYYDARAQVDDLEFDFIEQENKMNPDDEEEQSRLAHRKHVEMRKPMLSMYFQVSIFFMVYALVVGMIYAWKEKANGVFQFNTMILERNGDEIASTSAQLLDGMIGDITQNGAYVKSASFHDTGDPDDLYRIARKSFIVDGDNKIRTTENLDAREMYRSLIGMIESFEKCNALLSNNVEMPFPVLEITMYFLLLVIISIIAVLIIMKLKPFEKIHNIKKWNKISKIMDQNIEITTSSFGFDCTDDTTSKGDMENTMTLIASTMISIISVVFAIVLMNNTNSFTDSLYASDLFKNNMCYNI